MRLRAITISTIIIILIVILSSCGDLLTQIEETDSNGNVVRYTTKTDETIIIYFPNGEILREFDNAKSITYYNSTSTVKIMVDNKTYTYYNVTTEVVTTKTRVLATEPNTETREEVEENTEE